MNDKLVFLLPSYIGDIKYVDRLVDSYIKYNTDNIPLYIIVPECDLESFIKYRIDNIKVLTKEYISGKYLVHDNSIHGIRPGYINQEIIKLSFWEQKLCENYFCLDSDGEFIRNFYISDFMYDDVTPYTIIVEDNELAVEPEYYTKYWDGREKLIRLIQNEVGLSDKRMLTCHGFAILSCKVLESFKYDFLIPKKIEYKDALNISPYEFSWYNMWLQKNKTIPIEVKEPVFKVFHHKHHHLEYLKKGITLKDISRGYIGVVINSNYSREYDVVSYEDGNVYFWRFYKKIINGIKRRLK